MTQPRKNPLDRWITNQELSQIKAAAKVTAQKALAKIGVVSIERPKPKPPKPDIYGIIKVNQ